MNASFVFGLGLGMLAALMLNVGKGVQKQKVHVFLNGRRMFSRPHRADLGVWLLGLSMTAGAAVPFSLGLKFSGSPSAISAMTGVGLIGLTVYATRVIGERLGALDGVGIALVVAGTSALGYVGGQREAAARALETGTVVFVLAGLVAGAVVACLAALAIRRIHGVVFGLTAGMCIGIALFLADAALVEAGGSFFGQLGNPYPYAALVFSVAATAVTQFGFLRARALEVVPAVNSAILVTPLVLEIAVYGQWPHAASAALIAVIFAGVLLLSTGTAAKVAA